MSRIRLPLPRRQLLAAAAATSLTIFAVRNPRALASVVLAMELPELTARADTIVVGEVASMVSRFTRDRRSIRTEIVLRVHETWKDRLSASRSSVKLVQLGGVVGDVELRVHGLPSFEMGESAVVFLNPHDEQRPERGFMLTGLGQGKRKVFTDRRGELMAAPADRSAAIIQLASGGLQAAPQDLPVRLSDLREQVRLLLREAR